MKVRYEFDTESKNYNPHDLWLVQNAGKMWLALCELREQFRQWAKYREDAKIDTEEVYEKFFEIVNEHGIVHDDII